MLWKSMLILMYGFVFVSTTAWGDVPDTGKVHAPEFKGSLNFQKGEILLSNGVAKLRVPENFRYLGPEDTQKVLVNAWGNPKDKRTLGMLVPAGASPIAKDGWGVVITYEEDGHVSDKDADSIDFDNLLNEMKKGMAEVNKERSDSGYERIDLIGWAVTPRYDKETRRLYWAKELSFGGSGEHTLNYNIRILGRKGVLMLNAVAGMGQLADIEKRMPEVLALTAFNPGHRYEDFDTNDDRVAPYGIAALVAGGIAAKTGLFYRILAMPFVGKIILIVLLSALGGFIVLLLKRKKSKYVMSG